MRERILNNKLPSLLLSIFILFTVLPVKLHYSSIAIIITVIYALIALFNKTIRKKPKSAYLFFLCIPFFVYLIGLLNTSNLNNGLDFVFRNASFLAFPLIFYLLGPIIKKDLLFLTYLAGLFLVNVYLTYLFFYYINFGERFYIVVTKEIYHSTYLGLYNLFAYWICIVKYKNSKRVTSIYLSLFYLASSLMTSSRIIFLLAFISCISTVIVLIESRIKKTAIILAGCIIFIGILTLTPAIRQKFGQLLEIEQLGFDPDNYESVSSRFGKISASIAVIRSNLFFGTGTGDLMDELNKKYKKMKFVMGYKYNYNPHNQYLDNIARNGIIGGGIALLIIYLFPLYLAIKKRNLLMIGFCFFVSVTSLTESILDVHKGITFYTFFMTLFLCDFLIQDQGNTQNGIRAVIR